MEENKGIKIFITVFILMFFLGVMFNVMAIILPSVILPAITNKIQGLDFNMVIQNVLPYIWISLGLTVVIYIVATYNKLVNLRQKVKQAVSGIDVYLKQRFDLIPNIVETVKGYANYEKEVLENITQIRNSYNEIKEGNIEGMAELNNRYTKMLAIVEKYPELKANETFLKLQKVLSKIESQLQAARRIYNSEVTGYNIKVMSFPSNVIAKIFRFEIEKLFEIATYERENVDVNI